MSKLNGKLTKIFVTSHKAERFMLEVKTNSASFAQITN